MTSPTASPRSSERERAYRAVLARDVRFDGRLFVGVRTTGVFCRPICRARTPRLENVDFYASAAAAQEAGFRPCLLCRPESSPDVAAWRGSSATVSRALVLIGEGALDDSSVESLASRLGMGERQLRRLFDKHLGTSPVAVAQSRRVLFAKKLVHETALSMTEIAHASGFGSVRRFNEAFALAMGRAPTSLRRAGGKSAKAARGTTLTLGYVPPLEWSQFVAFFRARALPGVEHVDETGYTRTIAFGDQIGTIHVAPAPGKHALALTVRFPDVTRLPTIVARVRRMFDLDADVAAIGRVLRRDPALRARLRARPGLRVPGAWDPFESAIRAILGQQVSVARAGQLAGVIIERWGAPVVTDHAALTRVFPSATVLADVLPETRLGMPGARVKALATLAREAATNGALFSPSTSIEDARSTLRGLSGIGSWTEEYVALRALRDPDGFPASDVGILRALEVNGERPTAEDVAERAEAWRPFRAYAAQHLWWE
ncbi:MAG: DNA-3-methyladenine glycosylase 2 family protein [Deltaproteobacteria bacterium]|nr:DNA-3-methyladenine glycosylase 2 family protein [Deltaproteobacteria bacterium]